MIYKGNDIMSIKEELKKYYTALHDKIIKYSIYLTNQQINMLLTLHRNFLLLDVDEEIVQGREAIVAYNLERQMVLLKEKNMQNKGAKKNGK